MKILLCDDQPERRDDFVSAIRSGGQPNPDVLMGRELTDELITLFKYVKGCLADPKKCRLDNKSRFDDVDIVVLDNNLAYLEIEGARLTAESIAGYIRAFTKARYVISLNKNLDVDFDLRYLIGDYSTRADLALNSEHLANRALWNGNPQDAKDGFLPWYWPNLSEVADRRRKQIDFVRDHLDVPVADALGFDDEAIGFLSLHARGALSPEAEWDGTGKGEHQFKKLTFLEVFLAKDRSLPSKPERAAIFEDMKNGNAALREVISRVVAADIDLWFRRDVVGPQEPLVDIPHLLVRFPFLLGGRANDINEWNKCVGVKGAPYGLEKQLYDAHLADRIFKDDIWAPAPCFWWPKLKADRKLNESFLKANKSGWADVVFCEDCSTFLERIPKGAGKPPFEFPAEFEGSWGRRYISWLENVKYAPRSRLAT